MAWALDDKTRWWEKGRGCYWPDDNIPDDTVEGWIRIFEMSGYVKADSKEIESGFEKAIYSNDEGPTHAARQTNEGQWTSILGWGHDIDHETADALEGKEYGSIVQVMKRRVQEK